MPALGPTQPPIQWTLGFFPEDKAAGAEVNHSSPPRAQVNSQWSYTFTSPACLQARTGKTVRVRHPYYIALQTDGWGGGVGH
jgi:hypothetical protein